MILISYYLGEYTITKFKWMGFWKYGYFNGNHHLDFFESIKKVSSEVTKMASDLVDKSANEAIVLIIQYLNE